MTESFQIVTDTVHPSLCKNTFWVKHCYHLQAEVGEDLQQTCSWTQTSHHHQTTLPASTHQDETGNHGNFMHNNQVYAAQFGLHDLMWGHQFSTLSLMLYEQLKELVRPPTLKPVGAATATITSLDGQKPEAWLLQLGKILPASPTPLVNIHSSFRLSHWHSLVSCCFWCIRFLYCTPLVSIEHHHPLQT